MSTARTGRGSDPAPAPPSRAPRGERSPSSERTAGEPARLRTSVAAAVLLAGLLAFAWIGRSVTTIDGALVVSDAVSFYVNGRFESAPPTTAARTLPSGARHEPSVRSQLGLLPSLLVAVFLAPAWPARGLLGARGLEAFAALSWSAGAALAAFGFFRLARVLRPGLSPAWAPAFVAGTFLWPYAAESFLEPWSGGLLALGAAAVLRDGEAPARHGALGGLLWGLGACLKPVLWPTAAVLVLAAALEERRRPAERRGLGAGTLAGLGGAALFFAAVNLARTGSPLDVGYGSQSFLFVSDLGPGLFGLTVSPGRGLLLFAPVVLASFLAARRLTVPAALVCFAAPALVVLLVGRWHFWDGSTCWGPRLVLGALPLLAAPAVLRPRPAAALLLAGALLNLPGVLAAPGAWISWVERLAPREGAAWPRHGSERVSTVPSLSPLYGHVWLLAGGDRRPGLPAPWSGQAHPAPPAPRPAEFVSPAWLRAALGLAPLRPVIPRLLTRSALGWALRGRVDDARRLTDEALRLAPDDRDARALASALASAPAAGTRR